MKNRDKGLVFASLMLSASAFAGSLNLDREHVPNELIVKFKDTKSVFAINAIRALGGSVKYQFHTQGAQVVKFQNTKSDVDLAKKAKALMGRGDVEYVEANTIMHISRLPNDTEFAKQYGMHNTGLNGGIAGADIHAPEAWEVSTGSKNVVVGIIDTGVDYTHKDIAPNYWENPGESGLDANGADKHTNGIDDDGNGFIDDFRGWDFANNDNDPMDDHAHGTHCAGVIGAHGNDGNGVTGVNWDVSLVGLKFLTGSGSGTLENAVKAIEYGTSLGLTLTSNSWGGGGFSQTMLDAIKAAGEHNVLFVAAAGNNSSNNDSTASYPASYDLPNVISVAASDNKDQMASFSNFGSRTVHVAAPGVDIFSSVPGNTFRAMSGTSMATPHVAGLAALIKATIPTASASQIRARILGGVDRSAYWSSRVSSGGRINALNSIEIDSVAPSAVNDLALVAAGSTSVTLNWTASGDDDRAGQASAYELRFSAQPIDTDAAWAAATPQKVETTASNGVVTGVLTFADFNQHGYIAVRAIDNVGNSSLGGQSIEVATRQVRRIYDRGATSMDGFTADAPWAIETLADSSVVFSDSPGGNYAENGNFSLTSNPIPVSTSDVSLAIELQYDLESGYDFLNVEVSKDAGVTWSSIDKLTGLSGANFVTKFYNLQSLNLSGQINLRFRLTSDSSVAKDGVHLKNVALIAPI
jgi:subtilisin family serine protease